MSFWCAVARPSNDVFDNTEGRRSSISSNSSESSPTASNKAAPQSRWPVMGGLGTFGKGIAYCIVSAIGMAKQGIRFGLNLAMAVVGTLCWGMKKMLGYKNNAKFEQIWKPVRASAGSFLKNLDSFCRQGLGHLGIGLLDIGEGLARGNPSKKKTECDAIDNSDPAPPPLVSQENAPKPEPLISNGQITETGRRFMQDKSNFNPDTKSFTQQGRERLIEKACRAKGFDPKSINAEQSAKIARSVKRKMKQLKQEFTPDIARQSAQDQNQNREKISASNGASAGR